MYYYKKKGKDIIKYEVKIEREKLNKIRFQIINNCSHIEHVKNRVTDRMRPSEFDYEHIRNYNEKYLGVIEYNDFYSTREDEYSIEYDYYKHPPLVGFINNLLNGDTNAIEEIQKLKDEVVDKEQKLLDEQQKIISKLNSTTETNKEKQIYLLNENQEKLLEYYKEKELNKNQVPSSKYKNKVLSCIELKQVEIIPYKTVLEVMRFFACCSAKKMESSLNKVLKLKL